MSLRTRQTGKFTVTVSRWVNWNADCRSGSRASAPAVTDCTASVPLSNFCWARKLGLPPDVLCFYSDLHFLEDERRCKNVPYVLYSGIRSRKLWAWILFQLPLSTVALKCIHHDSQFILGSDKCYCNIFHIGTVELHLSGRWLTGSAWFFG